MLRTPFNLLDDAFLNIERREEPWSIHFELVFEGRIDPQRLAAALRHACLRHPLARARVAPYREGTTRFDWDIPDEPDHLPLTVVDAPDEAAIARARDRLVSVQVPPTLSPGFLLYLVRSAGGDRLMANLNHVIADGLSTFRIFTSIIRHYAGLPDPVPDFDPLGVRDLKKLAGSKTIAEVVQRLGLLVEHLVTSARPPARVHSRHDRGGPAGATGYGCTSIALSVEETAKVMRRRVKPATVNDLVLAGMLLAIAEWNRRHRDPPGRITAMMPVNLRPQDWWFEVVSNFSSYVSVSLPAADQGDLARATAAVCEQTRRLKEAGASGILIDVLDIPKFLPAMLKARLRDITPTLGRNLVDSTWVTNLGRLGDIPAMGGAGQVHEIFFSPPAPTPMGITVGVATYAERLFLSLRYRKAVLDQSAAAGFAALYREILLGS